MEVPPVRRTKGFGLLDLILILIVFSLVAALAVPVYGEYAKRMSINRAIEDLAALSREISSFQRGNDGRNPATLQQLGISIPLDPWGNAYRYVDLSGQPSGSRPARKDDRHRVLNTDFDLYSGGADGVSRVPLSARGSRDDVLRANNGLFIGLAEDY